MSKSLWRCHVCNDIHLGIRPPEVCPTCNAVNAFVRTDRSEALKIPFKADQLETKEAVIDTWREFVEGSESYRLNPDQKMVATLAEGVLENMRNHGLRYCPCRMTSGDFVKDLRLVCPCNFPIQKVWKEEAECWCGLFLKR